MSDPPKRFESELTVVIDRTKLPPKPDLDPISTIAGMTIEQLADVQRARRDAEQDRETQMECPWCHVGLVSPTQHDAWLERYPELVPPPPSQPEEPPPSRPEAA